MKKKVLCFLVCVCSLPLLSGCETMAKVDSGLYKATETVSDVDRVTGKRELNTKSRKEQIAKSDATARQHVEKAKKDGLLLTKENAPEMVERAERVFYRVHAVSHLRDEKWTVVVVKKKAFNAFVMGGTYVFIFTGLLDQIKDDDTLAAVMGHELAHVSANHRYERDWLKLFNKRSSQKGTSAAFTLNDEKEADRVGIVYAALAGYDPMAASQLWESMFREGASRRRYYGHPANDERAEQTRKIAEKVKTLYIPGEQNPKYVQYLDNNPLWKKEKHAKAGKGGGILSLLSTALNTRTKAVQADNEAMRQEIRYIQEQSVLTSQYVKLFQYQGMNAVNVSTLQAVIQYRGNRPLLGKLFKWKLTVLDAINKAFEYTAVMSGRLNPGATYGLNFKLNNMQAYGMSRMRSSLSLIEVHE